MLYHVTAIWTFRHFLLSLVSLDVRKHYHRSAIGLAWSFLHPVAMALVFVLLFSHLLGAADPKMYAAFMLLGLAVWGFFKECAVSGAKALLDHEVYIRQCPLPYGLYPLRAVLTTGVHSLLSLGVGVFAVVILSGSARPLFALWAVIPVLALAVVAGWAVATIFSFVNVYFPDVSHILEVLAQVVFFLTPVMYPAEVLSGRFPWLLKLNPVNQFLELIRTPLLTGEPGLAKVYGYVLLETALLAALAVGAIGWFRNRVIFRM